VVYPETRVMKVVISVAAAILMSATAPAALPADGIEVRAQINGEEVIVEASLFVSATPQESWAVLTDYEAAPRIHSNIQSSTVLSRTADTVVVSQKGTKGFGPFTVSVETVKEFHLTPFEKISSRLLGGSMKRYAATTRLSPQGAGTLMVFRAESVPDVWIPPVVGQALIESETRTGLEQLRDEIIRRKKLK